MCLRKYSLQTPRFLPSAITWTLLLLSAIVVHGQYTHFKDYSSWNPFNYFGMTNNNGNSGTGNGLNNFQLRPTQPYSIPSHPNHYMPTQSPSFPVPSPIPIIPLNIRNNTSSEGLAKPCRKEPTGGQLFNFSVDPCEGEGYCTLKRGTNSTLQFEFMSNYPSNTLFGKLSGIFGWFTIPFGSAEDLCAYPGISCPIDPGTIYKVKKIIYVSRDYPAIELDTKLQVYGDRSGDIGCTLVAVKIQ